MIYKMTMIADSAERLRLSRSMLRSTRLIVRTCSTPAQSGHPVEMDPQGKVQMHREEESWTMSWMMSLFSHPGTPTTRRNRTSRACC